MLSLVSGQTVVHSESVNATITTLPRKSLSDMRWPNWFTRLKSGARTPPRDEPGSRSGFAAAWAALPVARPVDPAPSEPELPPLADPQPARVTISANAAASNTAGADLCPFPAFHDVA